MRLRNLYSLILCLGIVLPVTAYGAPPEPILELAGEGLHSWPASAKDRKVVKAVQALRERLGSLATELDLDPQQAELMQLGWDLLTSKVALRVTPGDQGVDALLVFEPGQGTSEAMYKDLTGLAGEAGFEFETDTGDSVSMMGPIGPMALSHDRQRLWVSMGQAASAGDIKIPSRDLPKGVRAVMSGRADVNALMEMFAPDVVEMIESQPELLAGNPMTLFVGPNASPVEFAVGVGNGQMHMTTRLIGASDAMRAIGTDPDSVFTRDDFRAVPIDAVRMRALQTNISAMLATIEQAAEASGENPLGEINEQLGVDLVDDVLANLGDRAVFYMSESTGGGGLLSSVLLVDLSDARAMRTSHARLVDRLNELARDEIDGYARVSTWETSGFESFTMTAPGLPIPLEPSWAIAGDRLVVALSPGSLEVALGQIKDRSGKSVLDQPAFKDSVLSRMPKGGAAAVSFADARRLARKGYGMTTMLASALTNAARSPDEPDRVTGPLLSAFNQFTSNVAPSSGVSWWDGDDLRSHYVGDESIMVQIATGLGSLADVQGVIVPAFAAGVFLPALGQAQISAKEVLSASLLRSINMGLMQYGMDHDDQPPASMDVLYEKEYLIEDAMQSPFGPAGDGGPDYTIRIDSQEIYSFDAQFIISIDRAMLLNGRGEVNVGFADSHVDRVDLDRLHELLDMPVNKGAREQLMIPDF